MAASEQSTDPNANIPDYEYTDVNTKPFHIGSFRTEWLNRLNPSSYSYQQEDGDTFDANFAKDMGIGAETMAELKSVCSVDSLRCHPEDQQPDTDLVPPDSTLRTLVQRRKRQDHRASLKISKNRHDLYEDELERLSVGGKPETVTDMVPEGELILTINVYYPAVFEKFAYTRPHMTLLVTGSHSLAELRDAICCVSDLQVCGEFSNTPDIAPEFISKDHHKSAFFYFEGVFYNDMRFPECQDISIWYTIIEYLKACIVGQVVNSLDIRSRNIVKALLNTIKQTNTCSVTAVLLVTLQLMQSSKDSTLNKDLSLSDYFYCLLVILGQIFSN
ncbi:snRNA-activating protein complex subunit 3 isoform X2 [Embiotoca jacksoni]|uniref:snRNA-activating protein complex subunit 3 isoform X2 n=1 Tax=Embiotoca jacksoni TaxID=100190 RepID=UPI0037046803